jgi:soluble P-type ATPase
MITVNIPGWGNIDIENVVLDLNGTTATDGKISLAVKDRINTLCQKVRVYVLTADTQGTAATETTDTKVHLVKIPGQNSRDGKRDFLGTINPESTVVIGNGSNDCLVLKGAALGIAVLGEEGASVLAIREADILVKSISDALDLFLKPKRLIATLRE